MMTRATNALNLHVLRVAFRPWLGVELNRKAVTFLERGRLPNSSPEELQDYKFFVGMSWCIMTSFVGVLCVGIGYLLAQVDGDQGHSIGLALLLFATCFCLGGACDAAWRYYLLMALRGHYRRANRCLDHSHPVVRFVRRNNTALLLQFAAGVFFAWHFS